MTDTTPTPGTDTGLSEYLQDMQAKACRLSGVMAAIAFLENEERCGEGKAALIYLAEELADELNVALDSVNIPTGVVT